MQALWSPIVSFLTGKSSEERSLHSHGSSDQVAKAVEEYVGLYSKNEEQIDERKAKYALMVNHYYDLVTDFYEYGWGQSFHFAPAFKGEDFHASIARHEHWLALKLGLKPGMKCVDLGCGVGGPMRCIARFSGAQVVGVNNNDYQIKRANECNKKTNLDHLCEAQKGNFMDLKYPEGTFDSAYAIEATCHAPERVEVFEQIYKVLKPGGMFASYEWTTTDKYDATNPYHKQIKRDIEEGDSLPDLVHHREVVKALTDAGFEVVEHFDLAADTRINSQPWYATLKGGWNLKNITHTKWGSSLTHYVSSCLCPMVNSFRVSLSWSS